MSPRADPLSTPLIQEALPDWHWQEYHQRHVRAGPLAVWQAIHDTRADALRVTRPLMWLRTGGRLPPSRGKSMISALPPRVIAADAPRELLLGLVFSTVDWWASDTQPDSIASLAASRDAGTVKVVTNMYLRPLSDGTTLLSTETRALAVDDDARRRFRLYWLMIRAGSGLIRRDILRAIARHVETRRAVAA